MFGFVLVSLVWRLLTSVLQGSRSMTAVYKLACIPPFQFNSSLSESLSQNTHSVLIHSQTRIDGGNGTICTHDVEFDISEGRVISSRQSYYKRAGLRCDMDSAAIIAVSKDGEGIKVSVHLISLARSPDLCAAARSSEPPTCCLSTVMVRKQRCRQPFVTYL